MHLELEVAIINKRGATMFCSSFPFLKSLRLRAEHFNIAKTVLSPS